MSFSLTYLSLGEFYLADHRRLESREQDLGLWWRTSAFGGPVFRAAYVEATGEVYVMQHEGRPGGGRVEVIAARASLADVCAELDGMDRICGEPGSLWWLVDRLATQRAPAPRIPVPA